MRFVKEQLKRALSAVNYGLGSFKDKILIVGDGRSGTNWLIDLLNPDKRYRLIYEPFHGWEFRPKLPAQAEYPFPLLHGADLERQFRKAARGEFITRNVTIEFPRALYQGLMIKDINAQLVADELDAAVPGMQKILIMRHPFAVAVSKHKYRAHHWPTEPDYFLNGDARFSGLLAPQADIIRHVKQKADRHLQLICVWCVLHRVLFNARTIGDYQVVFYEQLAVDAMNECRRLYHGMQQHGRFEKQQGLLQTIVAKRSRVTQEDNAIAASVAGRAAWQDTLDARLISEGVELLRAFGLEHIYADTHFPLISARQLQARLAAAGRGAV